jgi:arylsulfatase A-like enzyme
MKEPRDGPWLMSVNPYDPHEPFDAPQAYSGLYDPKKLPPPLLDKRDAVNQEKLSFASVRTRYPKKDEEIASAKASYYGMITLIDEQVGRMLEALDKTGQRENTVVIYTSDHGEMLGDHGLKTKGCRFNEGVVHVPLVISWPARFEQDVTCDSLVELTDLAPTIAELAEVPIEWTHGRSLVPILEDTTSGANPRDYVRSEYYDAVNWDAPHDSERHVPVFATMYFDGRYKLIVYHGHERGELYDLREDPHEFTNLWEDPESAAVKMELLKKSFDASIVIHDPGSRQIGRY